MDDWLERQMVSVATEREAFSGLQAIVRAEPTTEPVDSADWFTSLRPGSTELSADPAAWKRFSSLNKLEAQELLDWLATSKYQFAQLAYQPEHGFSVRFQ
jgi:hypothetical protein